ncbi:MAG: sugar ABC transporter permease [Spirochaetaceae bacterium]|jgi:multiple sugar transport system permease protein|nr:sugar ABC transporter permease [Spirochaetaceae bacterium]
MRKFKNEGIQAAAFIFPSFLLLLIFSLIPAFMNIFFSFTKFNVIQPPRIIGFANYGRLFKDPYIAASLRNTLIYMVLTVPFQTLISLILAALLAEGFRNRFGEFIRGALFIPVIASNVLVGTLWAIMFQHQGMVNGILGFFSTGPVNWLGDKNTAIVSVSIVSVWKDIGYYLVIYYAGIMSIPVTYYEAARVDGAGAFQRFWYITIPSLKPVTYLILTMGTIWSFQVFDIIYTMTGGGPGVSTLTLVYTVYTSAFKEFNMGYAACTALLLLCFVLILTLIQKRLLRDEGGNE